MKSILLTAGLLALGGCSSFLSSSSDDEKYQVKVLAGAEEYESAENLHYQKQKYQQHNAYSVSPIKNENINFYSQAIMQDLVSNLQYVNSTTPMAITSFVFTDGGFDETNIIGNQLAESLLHEVHKFGIPVIDFKSTGYIRVSPKGDFILTRDYLELSTSIPIKYVLVGTLTRQKTGYLVNARIIGINSKAVVGTAQSFIPSSVLDGFVDMKSNDGIKFIKG